MGELFDPEFVKLIGGLGVGGTIAIIIFGFYRKDVRSYTDLWKAQAEREDKRTEALMQLVRENSVATTTNTEVLRALHRRVDQLDLLRVVDAGGGEHHEAPRQIEAARGRRPT